MKPGPVARNLDRIYYRRRKALALFGVHLDVATAGVDAPPDGITTKYYAHVFGDQPVFICPSCAVRRRTLYRRFMKGGWQCRDCLGLRYLSAEQRGGSVGRLQVTTNTKRLRHLSEHPNANKPTLRRGQSARSHANNLEKLARVSVAWTKTILLEGAQFDARRIEFMLALPIDVDALIQLRIDAMSSAAVELLVLEPGRAEAIENSIVDFVARLKQNQAARTELLTPGRIG
jgi:hypothetical protein